MSVYIFQLDTNERTGEHRDNFCSGSSTIQTIDCDSHIESVESRLYS